MSYKKLREDVPVMSAGSGQIAGIGVGPQGEPGVNMSVVRRKKRKKDKQTMRTPMDMVSGGMVAESFKPLDIDLWTTAQLLAKSEYPDHPTPESTKFAIAWYSDHGGEVASNTAKNEATVLDQPTPSLQDIAKKHGVSVNQIASQLALGIKVEKEHTSNDAVAIEIALDHLNERPDYYTQLSKIEDIRKKRGGGWKTGQKESNTPAEREWGKKSLVKIYKYDTPGEIHELFNELSSILEDWKTLTSCQKCQGAMSVREQKHGFGICDTCVRKSQVSDEDVNEDCGCGGETTPVSDSIAEAEYQGRKVSLGKPFRTPSGPKKFSVYVKNEKGNVVKVNFGDPKMEIKRDDPKRRANFRARHGCDRPGPRWKARYWSCQWGWGNKKLSV